MKFQYLLIVILVFLTACSPAATLTPEAVSTPQPTSTPLPPTITPTSTPMPTQTPTATLSLPQQVGLPDSLTQQFPLVENEARYWTLFGNPDEDGFDSDFDMPAGDLMISSVVTFHYINAHGEADYVYVPVIVLNPAAKKCLLEGPSRPSFGCSQFINPAGDAFLSGDKVRFDQSALDNFVPSRKQIAELRFGYPSAVTQKIGSKGFLDNAISAIYPGNILAEFAESGDSSLLPNRLLIPWFFEASHAYSIQVATSTPLPTWEESEYMPTEAVALKDLSGFETLNEQTFPLRRDMDNQNFLYCLLGDMNPIYKWITPTILVIGTINCHYLDGVVQLPLGIYDLEENRLVYWHLFPLEDFTGANYLALRAQQRFISVTSPDDLVVKNKLAVIAVGGSEQKDMRVFNTYNFAPYLDAYYADEKNLQALMQFIETGAIPPDDGFIFPLNIGITTRQ